MARFAEFFQTYLPRITSIRFPEVIEVIIIAFLIYHILLWIKRSRAWSLLKGILVIAVFVLIANYFEMNTILWIVNNLFSLALTAVVIILQPELRKAVEELGRKKYFSSMVPFVDFSRTGNQNERFSDKTINEITKACLEMAKVKTGALIVIEQEQSLAEYERTGIDIDALVTSQLLINIFEHNTPLHDGAVIVRGNRITSATCYLPLCSIDNIMVSKDLGTRHRAGVGITEVTDCMTIIVSEQTGKISVAYQGRLLRSLDSDGLKEQMKIIQNKSEAEPNHKLFWRKGRSKGEKEDIR